MIMKDHWRHTLAVIAVYGLFLAVQSQSSGSGSGSGAGGPSQVLQITQDPYNVTVPVGGVAMFSCSIEIINIDTNDDDFVIDWFADGAFVNDTQESRVMITEVLIDSNTVRSNLSIADLELSDDDSFYSCGAVFGDTMVYSLEAILRIQYPASITIAPQSLVVNQSDDAIFTCTGFGIPVPSLKWLNGSMEIDAESIERISISEFNQVNDSGFTVAMSVLTIGSVIKADENTTFTCIGNNSVPDFINTDDTDYVTFTVQVPPMVTVIGDDNKLNLVGDRTTLEFQISEASPEVLVDDINLFFNNGVDVTEITAVFSSNTVRYDIIGIENGDEGNYTLVANNPAGSSEATVVLEVQAGPIILDQPVSQNIIEGSSVIFNCTSSSEPLHSISWTFNDELIASYDADTNMLFLFNSDKYSILDSSFVSYGQLTIDNVTFNDSGIYACNVSNIHESQQAYAQLTVQVPPNAIISTTMVTGVVGYAVSFSCVVKANPLPTIIWLVNGTILDISSEGSLFQEQIDAITVNSTVTLSNLNLNDIGQYSCNASNFLVEMKSDVSDELFLEVLHPVNITALEPTEVIINQTQQASFICQGYGIPLPNITWIKATDGNVVENITGITQIHEFLIPPTTLESVLTFVQGMNSDESTYKCQASNDVPNFIGSPEVDEVTLLVQVPVEIVDDPIDTVHFAGGSISLSCNASGVPIPTFSWYKDNNEYLSDSHPRIEITNRTIIDQVNEGLAESTITFFDLQLSDDADYHCQATNPGAHDTVFVVYSNQAHLTVEYPPNVTTLEPLEIIINQTQEAVFSCEAYGIPVPSISWIKVFDDAIVDNITGLTEVTESVVRTNTLQSVLRFVSGMNSNESIYTCKGMNGINNVINSPEEDNVTLLVQVPVEIVDDPIDTVHFAGGSISLSCNASGVPIPTFSWYKDNNEYLSDSHPRIEITNRTIIDQVNEGLAESTITFFDLQLSDDADYHCRVTNPGAHDTVFVVYSNQAHLTVEYPPNVTTLEPLEIIINQTQEAVFSCEAYGIPVPSISWIKVSDDAIVDNNTGLTEITESVVTTNTLQSVLRFVSGMNSNESIYTCKGMNGINNVINSPEEDNVTLLVQVPVEIVDDPIDTVHFAGGSISLSCNASGVPIPTFSWYKDNNEYLSDSHPRIEITNRTIIDQVNEGLAESTITFFDLQLSDDADYHCRATNPGAHDTVFVVYSNQAHLTVEYPPNVTTLEPLEIIINQTQEAVFSCEAYGIPVPSISWIKVSDDAIVDNNTGLTEITESVVTTNTLQSVLRFVSGMNSNESIYTCKGMNGINNVINSPEEDNVTLLVQVPVEIVDDPIDTVHFAGGSISLSCNASGVPIPTFSWYKDNNEYLSDSHPRIEITNKTIIDQVNEGLAESTITFFDLQLSDDADYHCRATNPGAHDTVFIVYSNQAHLLIEHPPNVTVEPQLTVINESTVSFIELECYSFGIPPPTLTWTKIRTGEVLISESLIQVSESVTHSSSMSVLRIYSPRDPDESNYTCKAVNNITNVLGTPESGTVELYVQDPAKVVRSPEGVTLPAGFPQYKMFCSAEGIPVPTITWLKDNVPLVDSGDSEDVRRLFIDPGVPFVFPTESAPEFGIIHSTLTLAELMLSDDAEYTCMAENNGAPGNVFKVYSDSVSINIEHPPLVSVEPVNLVINQTATVIFTCTIFGIPTPSFTWSKNPDPTPLVNITGILEISSFTEGNNITTVLTIFSTARTDMGEYKCSAINDIENLIVSPESSTATLFVQEPSLIIQNPTNVTNYINGSAEFTCQASGIPVPNIMWFRNDTLIGTGGRLTISETTLISPNEHNITSVLFINELQLSDTAFYHCVTDNPGAMDQVNFIAVSEVAFLKVQNPPSVFVSPLLTIINETNSTKFTCQVFGIPVPVVSWIRHREGFESEIIDGLGDPTITVSVSGYTVTSVLKFIEPLMNQEAIYECMGENNVTNVIGATETVNVSLFVQAPAQFTLHPQSQTNFTAGSISLSCIAVGLPPPTITWMKNEVEFTETDRITIESSESFNDVSGETNSSVLIENIVLEDAGSYHCVANNTGANGTTFRAFSRRITVTVLYPPSLSVVPVSKTVNQTDVVPLTCTVFALPRPEITWTDNREDIVINPLEGFISITENSFDNNTYTSVLTFLSIVKANESNYTCTAVNNVTNAIGAVDTAGSSLIVQVPATVTSVVGPVLDSRQGGTVVFQFILTNDSPPVLTENIRWYFRGVDVLEDITDTQDVRFNISSDRLRLEITGVTAAQEGAYILEALNEAGIGSGTIIFNIEGPPSIIIGPKDKIRREGDQVVFPCFATGDPEPTISWTFNNTEIQTDTKYNIAPITEGEDFGSLTVYDITYYDKGEYTCTVINVNGTSSDSAMLQVQVVPVITVHPLTQPGIAGGNVTLTCTAIGFPLTIIQPLNEEIGAIVWLKNNVLVTSELIPLSTIQRVPGNTLDITVFTSLTITDLQLRDVANYSCNASNDLFEPRFDVSNDAELTVLYPPNVAVSPKSFVVNQSQFINFTCTVFGIPIPILTWYDTSNLTDPLIATDETFFVERIYTNGSDLLLVESILVFSNALRTDMSSYTCVAVNDIPNILGTPESGEIVLHVQVPAEITASPVTNIEHFRGGVTNISCSAFGLPLPTVTWYRNDEVLQLTNRVYVVEDISISDTEGNITSTLVFGVVELVDNASYYCVANNTGAPGNEFVMQSDSSFLFVTHPPDVLLTPSTQLTVNVTFEATLVCFVFAIPLPKITWIRNSDKSIVEEQPGRVSITQEDNIHNRTSTLFFSETLKTDESFYTCVAVNNITNVIDTPENATVDLIVQVPANVTAVTDSPIIGVDTESVVLQFVITQDDPLIQVNNIRWEFLTSDGLVEDITTSSITDPHYELSADRLSLTIVQLNFAHQGRYTLFATNEAGTRSNSIDLFIQRQPILLILPQPQTKLEGDSVTFMCLASANPIPYVTWTFQGQPITNKGRFSIGTSGVLFGALTIDNIIFPDQGSYKCRFDNPHGSVEANTQLTVQVSPVFQDITVPVNGTAGSSVSMTCNSTGVPVPSITWLKDGNPISSTPGQSDISFDSFLLSSGIHSITSTLQLMGLVLNDTSNYSCTADNVLARPQNELSDELPLLVLYPPDVSIDRDSLTVNQSDLSSFTCKAFGIPLPSFTWFFNGSSISTNNGYVISNSARINGSGLEIQVSTLTILNSIRSIHEGSYTCRASNDIDNLIGTPESVDALLTVQVPPRVQAITEDPVGVVNRTVTLSFLIDQASPVVQVHNIEWRFDDTTLLNNGVQALLANHMFSADVLSLTLTNIQHSDQGVYSVTATNEAGFNSSEIFLEVEAAPVITVSPTDTMQLEGLNVTFECEAVAEPLYTVEWKLNETSLNNSSNKYLVNPITGQLSIYSVVLEDTGMYTCIVDNIHGNDSASATLTVQSVPEFTVNPVNVSVLLIGETVQLNCSSFAVPVSNITWLKDESVLDLSDQSITVVASVQEQVTFSELTISNLDFINTGSYSCMAVNELVSKQYSNSTLSQIIVNMPVVIVESPKDSIVNETDVAVYKCIADGLPTPSITWSTPDVSDLTSVDFVRVEQSAITESMGSSRVESILTFPRIQDTEANTYTCTASNIPRDTTVAVNESFNIIVQTKPVVVFTGNGTVVGVEFREAEMRFNVSRDLPLVLVDDIRWFFKQQGFNTRREIIDDDRYTFSEDRLTLTVRFLNLTDSGTYTVEASNVVGTGSASAALDVQKAPVIIVPLVSLIQLSGTTATFICEAEANPRHTIEWTKNDEQIFNSSRILITGLGTAISTLTITDLQLNDTGSYTCFAENVHGNDSTTDELFVQVPPSFIDNPTPVNLTAGSSVTVLCNVTGFPQPEVDILKDGVTDSSLSYERSNGSLPNGLLFQSVSLLLSDVTFADTALYSCSASNELASLVTNMSPAALHTVQYAPDVSVSPLSVIANESDSIVLVCQVSALPVPNIVWLNSSSDVSLSAPTESGSVTVTLNQSPSDIPVIVSNLSISGILKIHEANYTCVASNGIENLLGTPENATVPVIVQVPPTVIAVDSSVLGVVNGSVTLMFIIERASPEVLVDSIRWSFVGSESVTSEDITTPSDSRLIVSMNRLTLTIYNIANEDEGSYTLTASNPAGISTDTITFSVQAAPVFVQIPIDQDRLQEETAIFQCSAVSEPAYSIKWEKGGETIAEYLSPEDRLESVLAFATLGNTTGKNITSDDSKYRLAGNGSNFGQLTIFNSMLTDEDVYTCTVSNVHGALNASATLTVQVVPSFPGMNFTVVKGSAGENITLICNTEGSPLPNITWYKNGIEIVETSNLNITEQILGSQRISSELTLSYVTRLDDGVYWCNATNFRFVVFENMSPTTTITIYYPPNVIKVPITLQRQAAQYAVFECQITSFPAPVIQWTRTGSVDPITDRRGKFEIKTTLDDSSITGPYSVETQLVIFNLSFIDQQTYTCAGISQVNVQNFINARSNASASLFVNVPPRVVAITASPSIAEWSKPFTITFDVLNAQPQVTPQNITWRRFDPSTNTGLEQIVASDRLVFSSNRRSLEITSVRLSDIGRYILTAINTGGSSTASIAINVLVAPVIENGINASLSVPVDIGNTISFTCRADGIPTPTLMWRRNGTVIATTGRTTVSLVTGPSIRTEIPTMESVISTVTLRDVKESDDYTRWTCTAENSVGINEHYYILRVEENDFIDPCLSEPCENNGTCFTMTGLGVPFVCLCTDGYTGDTCVIAANPIVIFGPRITVPPRPISSQLYSIVNLTCIAEGNPQPNIEWYKDDAVISDAKAFLYTFELGVNSRGWYMCRAVSNLEGGRSEQAISDPVLVTIDNVAQYLMTSRVSISLLQNIYGSNLNNEQLVNKYIELLGSDFTGEILRNGSVIFSVSLHALIDQKDTYNSTFSAIVTLVTDAPNLQELYSFLLSFEGTPSFVLHDLIRFDGCVSEVTSFSPSVYWPETNLGINSTLECPCGDISLGVGQPRASRRCGGTFATGAEWREPLDSSCVFDNRTKELCDVNQLPSVEATVQSIDSIIGRGSELSPLNLLVLVSALEALSLEDVVNNANLTNMFLSILDDVLSSGSSLEDAQREYNLSSRILVLLDSFGSLIKIGEDGMRFITASKFQVSAQLISNITSTTLFEGRFIDPPRNADARISIPQSLFLDMELTNSNHRLVYTAYPIDSPLFSVSSENLTSSVIAATVPGVTIDNLSENNSIVITFISNENVQCVFWNFANSDWDSSGCVTTSTTNGSVICACNHLTHFALISIPEIPSSEPNNQYEDVLEIIETISIALAALSIACLTILFLTFVLSWNLRTNPLSRLFIFISTSLIVLYLMYIGSVYAKQNSIACTVFSSLFHYAFLATLFTINGSMICTTVNIIRRSCHNYPNYMGAVSFVTPLIIVGFLAAPLNSQYTTNDFCHPEGLFFYLVLGAPLVLTAVIHILLFITNCIILRMKGILLKAEETPLMFRLLLITALFTLGWSFSFAGALVEDSVLQVIFRSLFLLFSGPLGVYVLLINGFLNGVVRNVWISWFKCQNEERKYDLNVTEMSTTVPVKNGRGNKPILEFKEMHYGPKADFRSPEPNESELGLEKEEVFNQSQKKSIEFGSQSSSNSSLVGYPVAEAPSDNFYDLSGNSSQQHYNREPFDQYTCNYDPPDSDDEATAL